MAVWLRALGDQRYLRWGDGSAPEEWGLADLSTSEDKPPLRLLVEGDALVTHWASVPAKARRHLARLLPFQLEEHLLDEVAACHFAWAEPDLDGEQLRVLVALCRQGWLAEQLAPLRAAGIEVDEAHFAPLCLPAEPGTWVLRLDRDLWLRLPDGRGVSLRRDLAPLVLERLLSEEGEPQTVLALAACADELLTLRSLLPEPLQAKVQTRIETTAESVKPGPINVRQGHFAKPLPWQRWWREWRAVAALVLVTLLAYVAVQGLEYRQLSERRQMLSQQIESQYRQVVPQGPMVEPVRQLKRQLAQVQGTDQGRGAVALLNAVLPVVAESGTVELRNLSFNRDRGELRLQCWAASFEAVEGLRRGLEQAGLAVELINTSADGDGQQARLRVQWRSA